MLSRAPSLRLKLAGWFVLVFFMIQTTLLGGIAILRREMIERTLENELSVSAAAMVDNILAAEVDWDDEQLQALVPAGSGFVLFAIRDEAGAVLASWGVTDADQLRFSGWEVVPAGPVVGAPARISAERAEELTGTAERLRLVTLPFRRPDEQRLFYFQAAVPDEALDRLLGPFVDLVLLGVPVGVAAAVVAAWVIAGRAVNPIQQLSEAARDVSPTSLSQRSERFEIPTTDREVARLENELNLALERLEAGYRGQDQFIANVSHELRTPVAVLLTQAQVAKIGERSLEKSYAFVEKAEDLLKRLGKVVESLLVLARADLTGGPPRVPVSVIDIVLGCLQRSKDYAMQNQVRLIPRLGNADDIGQELVLEGDADLLQTMVENLVNNAISHSPPQGEVSLEVEHTPETLQIAVRDEGPGIPAEYRERIFERFVQVPNDSARRDGTGLGLAIANGIAKLHAGRIEVTNNETAGCTFVVTLPLRESAEQDETS